VQAAFALEAEEAGVFLVHAVFQPPRGTFVPVTGGVTCDFESLSLGAPETFSGRRDHQSVGR
jgi:hypothetical protein